MQKYRRPLLVLGVAVAIALVAFLLLRDPAGPGVDATTGGSNSLLLLAIILVVVVISAKKKNGPR